MIPDDGGTIFVSREMHGPTLEWFEKYAGWKPVSDVQGKPEYLALFHLFDPNGNRLNFHTFIK
jgi:hypothetical protein